MEVWVVIYNREYEIFRDKEEGYKYAFEQLYMSMAYTMEDQKRRGYYCSAFNNDISRRKAEINIAEKRLGEIRDSDLSWEDKYNSIYKIQSNGINNEQWYFDNYLVADINVNIYIERKFLH